MLLRATVILSQKMKMSLVLLCCFGAWEGFFMFFRGVKKSKERLKGFLRKQPNSFYVDTSMIDRTESQSPHALWLSIFYAFRKAICLDLALLNFLSYFGHEEECGYNYKLNKISFCNFSM